MSDSGKAKGPRACNTCARAKSRCVASTVPDVCERCHRLNKPCGLQIPATARKRRSDAGGVGGGVAAGLAREPRHGTSAVTGRKTTRVAELERRLEDLTCRLDSVTRQQQQQQPLPPDAEIPGYQQRQQSQQQQLPSPPLAQPSTHTTPTPWPSALGPPRYTAPHIFPSEANGHQHPTRGTVKGVAGGTDASAPQADISPATTASSLATSPASNEGNGDNSNGSSATTPSSPKSRPMLPPCQYVVGPSRSPYISAVSASTGRPVGGGQPTVTTTKEPKSSTRPEKQYPLPALRASLSSPVVTPGLFSRSLPRSDSSSTMTCSAGTAPGTGSSNNNSNSGSGGVSSSSRDPWPQPGEAAALVDWYRQHAMQLMPFVVVPAHVSEAQLRAERPFVWKAMMMAAMHLRGERQTQMGSQLLADLAATAFLQSRRSLDLLQGLLLWMCWYLDVNSFQLNNTLFLARSLCVSLGISELAQGTPGSGDGEAVYSSETLEAMRAYAGTFYVVSAITTPARKPDTMMSTAHLDRYCAVLERQLEYPTDRLLGQLVRVQQLAQSISIAFQPRSSSSSSSSSHAGAPTPPPAAERSVSELVPRLQQQVEAFRAQLPAELHGEGGLMGHLHIAEILLYEVGMQDSTSGSGAALTAAERLGLLEACKQATTRFLQSRFSTQLMEHPRYLCMTSFDYVYGFLTALRLMSYQLPGWNARQARRDLHFDMFLDRQIEEMEMLAAKRTEGQDGGGGGGKPAAFRNLDWFARLAARMAKLRLVILRDLNSMTTDDDDGSSNNNNNNNNNNGSDTDVDAMLGNDASTDTNTDAAATPVATPAATATAASSVNVEAMIPFTAMFSAINKKAPGRNSTPSLPNPNPDGNLGGRAGGPLVAAPALVPSPTPAPAPAPAETLIAAMPTPAGSLGGFDLSMPDATDPMFTFYDTTTDFMKGMDMSSSWPDLYSTAMWDEADAGFLSGGSAGYLGWGM